MTSFFTNLFDGKLDWLHCNVWSAFDLLPRILGFGFKFLVQRSSFGFSVTFRSFIIFLLIRFQVVEDGYEFFAKRQLVTLFSAPNYCGEFDNAGGMMSVDETLMCSFQVRFKFSC